MNSAQRNLTIMALAALVVALLVMASKRAQAKEIDPGAINPDDLQTGIRVAFLVRGDFANLDSTEVWTVRQRADSFVVMAGATQHVTVAIDRIEAHARELEAKGELRLAIVPPGATIPPVRPAGADVDTAVAVGSVVTVTDSGLVTRYEILQQSSVGGRVVWTMRVSGATVVQRVAFADDQIDAWQRAASSGAKVDYDHSARREPTDETTRDPAMLALIGKLAQEYSIRYAPDGRVLSTNPTVSTYQSHFVANAGIVGVDVSPLSDGARFSGGAQALADPVELIMREGTNERLGGGAVNVIVVLRVESEAATDRRFNVTLLGGPIGQAMQPLSSERTYIGGRDVRGRLPSQSRQVVLSLPAISGLQGPWSLAVQVEGTTRRIPVLVRPV